jgi:hypothetical protein
VTVWNRIAPDTLPTSARTPNSGSLPFSAGQAVGGIAEEDAEMGSPVERGVEKMKDVILEGLSMELKPQTWFYRVWFLTLRG